MLFKSNFCHIHESFLSAPNETILIFRTGPISYIGYIVHFIHWISDHSDIYLYFFIIIFPLWLYLLEYCYSLLLCSFTHQKQQLFSTVKSVSFVLLDFLGIHCEHQSMISSWYQLQWATWWYFKTSAFELSTCSRFVYSEIWETSPIIIIQGLLATVSTGVLGY